MSGEFITSKFVFTQEQYTYLQSIFHEKAGIVDLETYFSEYNTISSTDPGAVLSNMFLKEVELHFDTFYRDTVQTQETTGETVIISLAVDPTRKHRLQEKFNAASIIDEQSTQVCQKKIFEQVIHSDVLDSLEPVY